MLIVCPVYRFHSTGSGSSEALCGSVGRVMVSLLHQAVFWWASTRMVLLEIQKKQRGILSTRAVLDRTSPFTQSLALL